MNPSRGYFGIGAEGISKPMNLGALMRTAHAFGASFTFSVDAAAPLRDVYQADTSKSFTHVPYYAWGSIAEMALPRGCALVGVELTPDAVDLPRFPHPPAAAYVLGRERGDLSEAMLARCAYVVRIPTRFCINLSLAGALVMYDRLIALGGYPPRPRLGEPVALAGAFDEAASEAKSGSAPARRRAAKATPLPNPVVPGPVPAPDSLVQARRARTSRSRTDEPR